MGFLIVLAFIMFIFYGIAISLPSWKWLFGFTIIFILFFLREISVDNPFDGPGGGLGMVLFYAVIIGAGIGIFANSLRFGLRMKGYNNTITNRPIIGGAVFCFLIFVYFFITEISKNY